MLNSTAIVLLAAALTGRNPPGREGLDLTWEKTVP